MDCSEIFDIAHRRHPIAAPVAPERMRDLLSWPVVRALEDYIGDRTTGPIFLSSDDTSRYPYRSAHRHLGRLCRSTGLPAGVTPHSLQHSFATEALGLGAALQDVPNALGHADPRTTRRYDRSRQDFDRSPDSLLASFLTVTERD